MNPSLSQIVSLALTEDVASRDITSQAVFGNRQEIQRGVFLAKQDLVLSGLEVAEAVFKKVSPQIQVKLLSKNGAQVKKGKIFAEVKGNVADLLRAERVALNFLQRLCGVATLTRKYVEAIKPYQARILDTRKTTPGLRQLEKKAVVDGGGANHRMNLSDMYLIKDNHIAASGGIGSAIDCVREHRGSKKILIEAEAKNLREVKLALVHGVDIILLDNMKLGQIKKAVSLVRNSRVGAIHELPLLEISGGVTLKTVRKMAATGVARISIGALTHSAPAVDISFEIEEAK